MTQRGLHRRLSFCCPHCRKRLTPPSVRFLGRKVYLGAVVVLAAVLRQGPTPWRVARLRDQLGVTADTLRRWHRWRREAFVRTAFWRVARSRIVPPVDSADLPRRVTGALHRRRCRPAEGDPAVSEPVDHDLGGLRVRGRSMTRRRCVLRGCRLIAPSRRRPGSAGAGRASRWPTRQDPTTTGSLGAPTIRGHRGAPGRAAQQTPIPAIMNAGSD
jgi:hypothetical protein